MGVGGSGMIGLARLFIQRGYYVSGSDVQKSSVVSMMCEQGLIFFQGHSAENPIGADLVVYSSAIKATNPEFLSAQKTAKAVVRRAEALAALISLQKGIIVAGTHGKTTTTSMMALVLRAANLNPSHYVGAEVPALGSSAELGDGEWFVAEGDESDGTITTFLSEYSIILNIEEEHLDFYNDIYAIREAFNILIEHTSVKVIYCADDKNAFLLCSNNPKGVSYGLGEAAYIRGRDVQLNSFGSSFSVYEGNEYLGRLNLFIPGEQNVANALAVVALSRQLGLTLGQVDAALREFTGAKRRFEVKYKSENFSVVDDYAHHPTEIKATLAAAQNGNWKRVIALFQPHRYSRTKALKEEFATAFKAADYLFLTQIYAASEAPMEGVSGEILFEAVRASGQENVAYEPHLFRLQQRVSAMLEPGDLVITLGAGNILDVARNLAEEVKIYEMLRKVVSTETKVCRQEHMRKHTALHVGGPAQFFVDPISQEDFVAVKAFAEVHHVRLTIVESHSHIIVRDGGLSGIVMLHPSMHGGPVANPGPVFRNMATGDVRRMIEDLGLRNTRVGEARISEHNGNLIVNDGGATAADVLTLIDLVRTRVKTEKGLELESDLIVLGDDDRGRRESGGGVKG